MNVPKRRKVIEAIIKLIEDKSDRRVGVATAPVDVNSNQAELPYATIYPIDGSPFSGPPLCGPQEDVRFDFQINSFGKRFDQAEWLADLIREIIIGRDENGDLINKIQVDGLYILNQEVVGSTGKLDNVGQIWMVEETFGFYVTSR
jgi:hypothetical protein